jgi:glycosyltransferase involved in cell wall biosynthesis
MAHCLASYVLESGVPHLAVVKLSLPFGPNRLLDRTIAFHQEQNNEVTEVEGLPSGLGPIIFSAAALTVLARIRVPGAPTDPIQIYQRVRTAGAQAARDIGLTGVSVPFDAASVYRRNREILPWTVEITKPEDVETSRRVLTRVGDVDRDDTATLRAWRQEQRRDHPAEARLSAHRACLELPSRTVRPRILLISNPSATTGAEQSLLQMIRSIDRQRFDLCALIGAEGLFSSRLRELGVDVLCAGVDFGQGRADDYLFASAIIRQAEPSIIHLNALSGSAVIAAAAEAGIPIVCHVRNRPGFGYLDAFSYSAAIVSVSQYIKSEVLQFGVPDDRIHVVYNGIDTEAFTPRLFDRQAVRESLDVNAGQKLILVVARITPYKRHDLIISALPLIQKVAPSTQVIALGEAFGEEEYAQSLRDRICELGIEDSFRFLPFQSDVRPFYAAADAFVLCSEDEPLARSVIEALAMEAPVVITDSGGTVEIVRHDETALIARPGDVRSVADCVTHALMDADASRRRCIAGRQFVEANLSTMAAANRMMQIYDGLIPRSRATGERHMAVVGA